jgi:adenylate cyclase
VKIPFVDLGERRLKNIIRPVRAYSLTIDPGAAKSESDHSETSKGPSLAAKPSIAVLPFANISGDPDQEYLADGLVEEIITELSRIPWLFVIARNSSFTYKGRAVDIKQVGREMGVRYVLEGSVRKASSRVRITGQLIDALSGVHLWADRFDGAAEDIFDLQDKVTAKVVGAVAPRMEQVEIDRAKRKPTESLDAYDCFLRAMASIHQGTKESNDEALLLLRRAINLDCDYAAAYGMAAFCYVWRKANGWTGPTAHEKPLKPNDWRGNRLSWVRMMLSRYLAEGTRSPMSSATLTRAPTSLIGRCPSLQTWRRHGTRVVGRGSIWASQTRRSNIWRTPCG